MSDFVTVVLAGSFTYFWLSYALAPLGAVLRAVPHVPSRLVWSALFCAVGTAAVGIVAPAAFALLSAQSEPAFARDVMDGIAWLFAMKAGAALWFVRLLIVGPPPVDGAVHVAMALALPSMLGVNDRALDQLTVGYLQAVRSAAEPVKSAVASDRELSSLTYTAVSGR